MQNKKTPNKIEDLIGNLEKIVEELEEDKLPIEDAMKKFEKGVKISKQCTLLLDNIENKMTTLLEKENRIKEEEYEL